MSALVERAVRFRAARDALSDQQARRPLDYYVHSSWASEWIAENLRNGWFYWHAANSGGKSQSLASLWVALLQGRAALGVERDGHFYDGKPWRSRAVSLPRINPPVTGAIGCPTYKLGAAGSIIDKIREAIGTWPHHEERIAGSVSVFHVMHDAQESDDWHDYSKLFVFPYEGPIPEGARLDFWGADEPPPSLWLSAILNRGKAGRPLYGGIGATPVLRQLWGPIKEQFPDKPLAFVMGRARVQSSVYDNRFLTAADIQRQEWANPPENPLSRAKLYGEHVDASGSCPFHVPTLVRMLGECRDPEIVEWRVPRETSKGEPVISERVSVEVFRKPDQNVRAFLAVDPSSGTDDRAHDPAGVLVVEMGTGELLARWNGYMAPYSLGILAAGLARQYGNAAIDVETNDHWGVNVIRGLNDCGYGNLCHEQRELSPGVFSKEVGFHNNAKTRPLIIGAVQDWIESWRAGVGYAPCPSRRVIETLMDCILDDKGRIVGAPGVHDEDLIVWGQCLRRAVTLSHRGVVREPEQPIGTNEDAKRARDERLGRMIQGLDDADDNTPGDWGGDGLLWRDRSPV